VTPPGSALESVLRKGVLLPAELERLGIPTHRPEAARLTTEQSARLARILRVLQAAQDTFGSPAKAGKWLRRPTTALADQAPLDLLESDDGANRVETLLGQIAHGIPPIIGERVVTDPAMLRAKRNSR
jgi:putative toxin-antitoxin system antitoxin component (TIGR02293 family)